MENPSEHIITDCGRIEVSSELASRIKIKGDDFGYLVEYQDGYQSWIPARTFEEGYAEEKNTVNFGRAIEALKSGKRVSRQGWNGKGMNLWLLPADMVKAEWCREAHLKAVAEANRGDIEALGSIRMMTADKKVLTRWLASQTDTLAEDWPILED